MTRGRRRASTPTGDPGRQGYHTQQLIGKWSAHPPRRGSAGQGAFPERPPATPGPPAPTTPRPPPLPHKAVPSAPHRPPSPPVTALVYPLTCANEAWEGRICAIL